MKNKINALSYLIILLSGIIYLPVLAQHQNTTQKATYRLDIKKSKLLWTAPKNRHKGFILFSSGVLSNLINGWPTQGAFIINMNSMKSTDMPTADGRKKVDDELRTENFFANSKYPTAIMMVNTIMPEHPFGIYKVRGELTIKGTTKPIGFIATMKQNGNTITARGTVNISRSAWNIGHQPPPWDFIARLKDNLVDDDIPVNLELVFTRK